MDNIQAVKTILEERTAMLVICQGEGEPQRIKLTNSVTIGRKDGKDKVDIELDSSLVAVMHSTIMMNEEGFSYRDLGNQLDTYLNDVLMDDKGNNGSGTYALKDGDIIRIDRRHNGACDKQAVVMFFKEKYDEKEEWKKASLEDKGIKLHISRHEEADGGDEVQTDMAELPKHYATLLHDGENWGVVDHNTRYGVYVNNQKIDGEKLLNDLDVIKIGNTTFLYWSNGLFYNHKESSKNKLVIHIEERSVWNLFRRKILLEDINLSINPGEMVLVLGGSGAGKTTFVNAVMGYEKAKGTIMEGDKDIYRNYNQMKYEIGFVPQQDLLRTEDSVYDTLENAARLKMPKATAEAEKMERIEEVLEMFGLEREKKSLVGKLSGGQRKRLSIAVEFIAKPTLFFLDEPDSGLDGVMARFLMENLRKIADSDKIVMVITHAPDRVLDLFDKIIVLAKSQADNVGHMAFYGSPEEAKEFFETDTMEGIVKRINRQDEGGEGMADIFIKKYQEIEKG